MFDLNAGHRTSRGGRFSDNGFQVLELSFQQRDKFARHPDVRQAIAAIAGDLDVEDGVVAMLFDEFHGQSPVRQYVGDGLRVKRAREKVGEPIQADLHATGNCIRRRARVKRRSRKDVIIGELVMRRFCPRSR